MPQLIDLNGGSSMLNPQDQEKVANWKATTAVRTKQKAEAAKVEAAANLLLPAPPAPSLDTAELGKLSECQAQIRVLTRHERDMHGTAELLRHSLVRLQERASDSDLQSLIDGVDPVGQRQSRIAQRIKDTESELREISTAREAKEAELRQRRQRLQESADLERRRLIAQMVPLLDRCQKLSQACDDIAHVCRDHQIEVPTYYGPSFFSISGTRDSGGVRRVAAGARSRHDEWRETLVKQGII